MLICTGKRGQPGARAEAEDSPGPSSESEEEAEDDEDVLSPAGSIASLRRHVAAEGAPVLDGKLLG